MEVRKAVCLPPRLSGFDARSALSILGVRSEKRIPILFLSSIVWGQYEKLDQLSELAWRCQKGAGAPKPGITLEYLSTHTAREAVRNLILPSAPITLAIANKLDMELVAEEADDQTIDRLLWKFGFNPPRYDKKYQRFRWQLQTLREELLKARARLSDDDRDAIRSKGVNVFVSLENFIEELMAFNVWILASDHFGVTRFKYKFDAAVAQVSLTLGASKEIGGQLYEWKSQGGNVLGTLLIYARLAAEWMLGLATADRSELAKLPVDLPHFVNDPARRFPFLHRELWADAAATELKEYAEQFVSLVEQLEQSRLAEVRNGLDHYRDEDKFPAVDLIVACESRLTAMLDSADLNRFIPKAYWLTESRQDQFGMLEYTLQDYNGRKLAVRGPAALSGIKTLSFSEPWTIPYGNLLGQSNSQLVFNLSEESSHSRMWANYPRRRAAVAVLHAQEPLAEVVSDSV
jgi:hypothetical protein